jgi:Cu(I)/Ag(I) efflux system membrane fusion protein
MMTPNEVPRAAKRRGLMIFAALLAAAALAAWLATRKPAVAPSAAHPATAAPAVFADSTRVVMIGAADAARIGVTFAPVTLEPVTKDVRAFAQVMVEETRIAGITAKIDGWVERLYVDYTGRPVARGEPLLSLYSPMLVSAQEELLVARHLEERVASGTPDAVAAASSLTAAARRRLAYWDVPEADIARLERTGEVTKTITLRAPASGVVVEKNVVAGQEVMAGQMLYRVADLSEVWLEGEVFEQDLAAVRVGDEATADLQSLPGVRRRGRVAYVSLTLDPETRTAKVRVALQNGDLALKPGMVATIHFAAPGAPGIASVPRSAVLSTGERSMVFVRLHGGRLEPHEVTLGAANDLRVQILRGLAIGDTVVASATFLVDAESNLGTAMGGMGDMPGMDMAKPVPVSGDTARRR